MGKSFDNQIVLPMVQVLTRRFYKIRWLHTPVPWVETTKNLLVPTAIKHSHLAFSSVMGSHSPSSIDWNVTPLVPPPPGHTSNLVNPVTRAPLAINVSAVVLDLAWVVTVLRFSARYWVLKHIWWDDCARTLLLVAA